MGLPRRRALCSWCIAGLHALQNACSVSKLRLFGVNALAGKLHLHAWHVFCSGRCAVAARRSARSAVTKALHDLQEGCRLSGALLLKLNQAAKRSTPQVQHRLPAAPGLAELSLHLYSQNPQGGSSSSMGRARSMGCACPCLSILEPPIIVLASSHA